MCVFAFIYVYIFTDFDGGNYPFNQILTTNHDCDHGVLSP